MYDLYTLFEQELNNYEDFLKLTHQLLKDMEGKVSDNLETLLVAREKIITKISVCEKKIEIFREKGKELSIDDKHRLAPLTGKIRDTIEEIINLDKKIEAGLQTEKDATFKELVKIKKARKASKGYTPYSMPIPRYIDKKGV